MSQSQANVDPIMQQISILSIRITDMIAQLNSVMKIMLDENTALKKENTELKAGQISQS